MSSSRVSLALAAVVLTVASCGGNTDVPNDGNSRIATLELDATYPEAFSHLRRIRALSDGSILAADPTAQVVIRLDFDSGVADTLGRQGAGPQEYDGPDRVLPLPGDSTLLVDLGNARLIVIDPNGEFVEWSPMTRSTDDGEAYIVQPDYVDASGFIYAMGPRSLEGAPDTITVHKINKANGEGTPVAWRWRTEYVRRERRRMLPLYDDWAVASDGRVTVVRANGYSVDWFLPGGTVVRGPSNDVDRFPVGAAEMDAEIEIMATLGIFTTVAVGEGGTEDYQMSRGIPASYFENRDALEWPETLPVFRLDRTLVSPSGEAWVHRMMPAGASERVEVFDDRGIRIGFVELAPRSQIIDFGLGTGANDVAYVARTDDMGLVWLERYRIVRADARQ